jgi:DNA-binding NtrC family response regulator
MKDHVLVVDDDPAWRRALERGLRDLGVASVSTVSSLEDVEAAIACAGRCTVLTELSLQGAPLAGFSVIEMAYRARAPAAFVAGCHRSHIDRLRAVPFLSKSVVNRTSLGALLRYLQR